MDQTVRKEDHMADLEIKEDLVNQLPTSIEDWKRKLRKYKTSILGMNTP